MKPRYHFLFTILYVMGFTGMATAQDGTFDFTTATDNGAAVTQTVSGVTLTYTSDDPTVQDIGGYGGTTGFAAFHVDALNPGNSELLSFDNPVNIATLRFARNDNVASVLNVTFTPNIGTPVTVPVAQTTGVDVTLNFVGVSTITVAAQNAGSNSVFGGVYDNIVMDSSIPVELTSFEAVTSGQRVQLRWATASETNNAGFSVEMKQGGAFVERGFVAGNGTTLEVQQYSFDAGELAPGRYTFRLRQVDFDGAFEYSPEVEVAVTLAEAFHFSAPQPNPMRSMARFSVTVQQAQPVAVRVYDLLGRAVETLFDGTMAQGETKTFVLNRGNLPAGLYLIQLQGAQVQSTRQLTLL